MKTKAFFIFTLLVLTFSIAIRAQENPPKKKTLQVESKTNITKKTASQNTQTERQTGNQVLISYPDYDLELIGYKDSLTGVIVLPAKYSYSEYFFEDYAAINMGCIWGNAFYDSEFEGGKWGYIDKTGEIVIPVIYDAAFPFKNNKAEVKLNGETFYINKKGERVN